MILGPWWWHKCIKVLLSWRIWCYKVIFDNLLFSHEKEVSWLFLSYLVAIPITNNICFHFSPVPFWRDIVIFLYMFKFSLCLMLNAPPETVYKLMILFLYLTLDLSNRSWNTIINYFLVRNLGLVLTKL